MNSVKQASWIFFILIALGGSGWYFSDATPKPKLDAQALATTTDGVFIGLSVRQFNSQGQLASYMTTPSLRHIPNENTSFIDKPHIVISQSDKPAWEIDAQFAKSVHGNNKITFSNNVIVQQHAGEHSIGSTIKTDEITYLPKEQVAQTAHEITFEQPGNIVHAKGMKAYLGQKRIQLLSHARGVYEPKHA